MLNKSILSVFILGALASGAVAQTTTYQRDGHDQTSTNWVSRGSGNGNRYLGRFNHDKVRAEDPAIGVRVRTYDFVAATKDTMKIVFHDETAASSYQPKNKPTFSSGPHPVALGTAQITWKTPVAHPAADVWIGIEFAIASGSDGGYVNITRGEGYSTTSTSVWEMPGQGIKQTGNVKKDSYYAFGSAAALSTSGNCRTVAVEKLVDASKFVAGNAVVKTNQTKQGGITGYPGVITGWNSASAPDALGKNTHPATRADDLGFRMEGAFVKSKPCFIGLAAAWATVPVLGIELDFTTLTVFPVLGDAKGVAQMLVPNASYKKFVTKGTAIYWQGVCTGPGGSFLTSPAARQNF